VGQTQVSLPDLDDPYTEDNRYRARFPQRRVTGQRTHASELRQARIESSDRQSIVRPPEPAPAFLHWTALMPSSTPSPATRCQRLKAASHRDHDSVDTLVMAARPFADRERYGRFLQVQHRFHGSLLGLYHDAQLNDWLPGLQELSRFAALEGDFQDLALPLPATPAPVQVEAAQALGWLYCSEGSNLGAAFLFKQTQQLALDASFGARHLAAHPHGRALHWRAFVEQVDGLALQREEEAQAVAGAIAAFDHYRSHLRAVFGEECNG